MKRPSSSKKKQRSKSPSKAMPDVGAREAHLAGRDLAVLLEHRVRHAVREIAVGLVVDLGEAERQLLLEQVDADAGAAVAGIADDRERLELRGVDIGQDVVAPGRQDVERHDRALLRRVGELAGLGELADLLQARVAADRLRLLPHELEPVVVRRVVARRDHHAAIEAERRGREIDALRAAEADVDDVDAGIPEPAHQRFGELLARMADVAADRDAAGLQPFRVGAADPVDGFRIQFIRYPSADVIGLEAFRKVHVPQRFR